MSNPEVFEPKNTRLGESGAGKTEILGVSTIMMSIKEIECLLNIRISDYVVPFCVPDAFNDGQFIPIGDSNESIYQMLETIQNLCTQGKIQLPHDNKTKIIGKIETLLKKSRNECSAVLEEEFIDSKELKKLFAQCLATILFRKKFLDFLEGDQHEKEAENYLKYLLIMSLSISRAYNDAGGKLNSKKKCKKNVSLISGLINFFKSKSTQK